MERKYFKDNRHEYNQKELYGANYATETLISALKRCCSINDIALIHKTAMDLHLDNSDLYEMPDIPFGENGMNAFGATSRMGAPKKGHLLSRYDDYIKTMQTYKENVADALYLVLDDTENAINEEGIYHNKSFIAKAFSQEKFKPRGDSLHHFHNSDFIHSYLLRHDDKERIFYYSGQTRLESFLKTIIHPTERIKRIAIQSGLYNKDMELFKDSMAEVTNIKISTGNRNPDQFRISSVRATDDGIIFNCTANHCDDKVRFLIPYGGSSMATDVILSSGGKDYKLSDSRVNAITSVLPLGYVVANLHLQQEANVLKAVTEPEARKVEVKPSKKVIEPKPGEKPCLNDVLSLFPDETGKKPTSVTTKKDGTIVSSYGEFNYEIVNNQLEASTNRVHFIETSPSGEKLREYFMRSNSYGETPDGPEVNYNKNGAIAYRENASIPNTDDWVQSNDICFDSKTGQMIEPTDEIGYEDFAITPFDILRRCESNKFNDVEKKLEERAIDMYQHGCCLDIARQRVVSEFQPSNESEVLGVREYCQRYKITEKGNALVLPTSDGKVSVLDMSGKWHKFDEVTPEKEGFRVARDGDKFNYVGKDGNILLDHWVDAALPFKDGKAVCKLGDSKLTIDSRGVLTEKVVIERKAPNVGMKL